MPRSARLVGYAMASCQDPTVPCHRVVDRFGGTKAVFDTFAPGTQRPCWRRRVWPFAWTARWIWNSASGHRNHKT